MTQDRKDELYEQMIAWICENNTDDALFHLLHEKFGMTKAELHDHSIESLDAFFHEESQHDKAPYGGYWVSCCNDSGIERYNGTTGRKEICEGFYCQVYDDPDCEHQVDDFCLAVGYEISDTSDEELDRGIREYLGLPQQEHREKHIPVKTTGMELSDFISKVSDMVNSDDKTAVLDWVSLAAFLTDGEYSNTTLENELRELYLPLCYVRNNFSGHVLRQSLAMDTLGSEVIYGAMLFAAGYSEYDARELGNRGVLMNGYIPFSDTEKGSLSVVSLSGCDDILYLLQNEEPDHIMECIQKVAGLAEKDGVSIQTVLRDTAPAWLRLNAVTDPILIDAIKISCTASTAISSITVYDRSDHTVTQHSTQGLTTEQRNAIFCCGEAPGLMQQM